MVSLKTYKRASPVKYHHSSLAFVEVTSTMSEVKVVVSHDPASEEIKLAGQKRSIPEEIVTQGKIKSDGGCESETVDLQPITEKVIENTQTLNVGIEKMDAVKKDVISIQPKKKRKTRGFITVEEFNRFAQQQPFKWLDLPQDCIYKLKRVNAVDDKQLSGNFTNTDGISISRLLPQFVLDKLLELTETNVNIYIRSRRDHVDIATTTRDV